MKKLFGWILAAALATPAMAMDGRAVSKKVNDRDDGKDSYAKVEMFLTDASGITQARSMVSAVKDFKNGLSKTYIRFTAPASIAGTTFLSQQVKGESDEQFLFLPDLGRDRRIVSSQKDSDFVNTDFTYEDMEERDVDLDVHKILKEEKLGTYDCYVVESTPKDPSSSAYTRRVGWVPKDIWLPIRVEYYTKVIRQPTKTLVIRRMNKVQGIWTALEVEMKNHERNHTTNMRTVEMKYNSGLPDRMFTRAFMKQAR